MSDNSTCAAFFIGDRHLTHKSYSHVKNMFIGENSPVSTDIEGMKRELLYSPFFGNKLVVIDSFTDDAHEFLVKNMDCIPEDCMLVVRVQKLASKTRKWIKKVGVPKLRLIECGKIDNYESSLEFVKNRVREMGGQIDPKSASRLVNMVGEDAASLSSEIDKLLLFDIPITSQLVDKFSFKSGSGKFYSLYSHIGDGNFPAAVEESRTLIGELGQESVDQALMKILYISVRQIETCYGRCRDITVNRMNSSWWPDGKKNGNPEPSGFMKAIAHKICDRHGDGVQYLLQRVVSGYDQYRAKNNMSDAYIELKILAICRHKDELHRN